MSDDPRTTFKPSTSGPISMKNGDILGIKPVGGDKASTIIQLTLEMGKLTLLVDPFGPIYLSVELFIPKGFALQTIADYLATGEPVVLKQPINKIGIPMLKFDSVNLTEYIVTFTLDEAMEAFVPEK